MNFGYRVTRDNNLDVDLDNLSPWHEDKITSVEDAYSQLERIERTLKGKIQRNFRANLLFRRAVIYEALGDPRMLETAEAAYAYAKNAHSAFVLGVANHFHGKIEEAFKFYTLAYKYPHRLGTEMNILFGYAVQFLFHDQWDKAWELLDQSNARIVKVLQKQNCGVLPLWRPGLETKEISLIQEGGYGDIIQYSRFIPRLVETGAKVTIYMTPSYEKAGFVDFMKHQNFPVEYKSATEIPTTVPAIGFLDLCAAFRVMPNTIPVSHLFKACSLNEQKYSFVRDTNKRVMGLCGGAREKESIFCRSGAYRSLTAEQIQQIIAATSDKIQWVNLKHGEETPNTINLHHVSWDDTAGVIANCDAVVSVDTAPMHLAGAMSKPIYSVLSGMLEWKFGSPEKGDGCLWYPSMKVFRNGAFGFENSVDNVISFLKSSKCLSYSR